jgi:DNA-binding LytR/AlgR family response regulator
MTDKSIQVIIVDDEPIAQDILETYIGKIPGLLLAGKCRNALEAFQFVSQQKVDLMLLDINMPEITGMAFLKSLKDPPKVIFTTAYSEYALESYEQNAVDYLLKPVSFERFLKAINKAMELIAALERQGETTEAGLTSTDKIMFVKTEGKLVKIDLSQLYFVEGLKDYLMLWTAQGKTIIHSTMKNMEERLSQSRNFLRVHKSYIVNLDYVTEVDGNTIRLKDQSIAIGSTYKDEVNNVLDRLKFI